MTRKAKGIVHGAVSIVNAIASGKGATLGVSLTVQAVIEATPGKGKIILETESGRNLSSKLVNKTIQNVVSRQELEKNQIRVTLSSEIPTGYGLKSSSAISSAVSLASAKLFKPHLQDRKILLAGVEASIETKVSVTGAYDDACACYYGGFIVTDNLKRRIIYSERAADDLEAVIFIPKSRKRGNIKKLRLLTTVFEQAWNLAKKGKYWDAMNINGLATSAALNSDPKILLRLLENGAIGTSVSGNGPAIAAICKKENSAAIKNTFSDYEGVAIATKISNKKAEAYEM